MIEIEGLPEGWKAVAYRVPKGNIEFVFIENVVREAKPQDKKCLIVEKIQPHRIVLEETDEFRQPRYGEYFRRGMVDSPIEVCLKMEYCAVKIWRIKEEV
jgi:hypothetical protein